MKEYVEIKNVILTNFNLEFNNVTLDEEQLKISLVELNEKNRDIGVLYGEFNPDIYNFDIMLNNVTHHIHNIIYHEYDRCIYGDVIILKFNDRENKLLETLKKLDFTLSNRLKMRAKYKIEDNILKINKIFTWDFR